MAARRLPPSPSSQKVSGTCFPRGLLDPSDGMGVDDQPTGVGVGGLRRAAHSGALLPSRLDGKTRDATGAHIMP